MELLPRLANNMGTRRQAREAALQALYQCDTLADWSEQTISLFFERFATHSCWDDTESSDGIVEAVSIPDEFCHALIRGVAENRIEIDRVISSCSLNWSLARMCRVDRNIIRLATYELCFMPETPVNVIINEAIEVAKRFGADDSHTFINGVLDKIGQKRDQLSADPSSKLVA